MGPAKRRQQVHGRFEPRQVGHPRNVRRPRTWHVLGRPGTKSSDPEHAMFWVAQEPSPATQNMPCSGSPKNQVQRPRTCHVLGRRRSGDPEHGMFWVARGQATQDMTCSGSPKFVSENSEALALQGSTARWFEGSMVRGFMARCFEDSRTQGPQGPWVLRLVDSTTLWFENSGLEFQGQGFELFVYCMNGGAKIHASCSCIV